MKHTDSYKKQEENKKTDISILLNKLNYQDSFDSAAGWLNGIDAKSTNINPERRIKKMKEFFLASKIRIAYAVLALAFVVAACNYPVTSNENAGDVITWTVDPNNADALTKVKSLSWLSNGPVKVEARDINGVENRSFSFVIPKENHDKAAAYKSDLEKIPGVSSVKIVELNQTVKRPVYSEILHQLFKIDINATNMSDDELKSEITGQLERAGIMGAIVKIERTGEARRVKIEFEENSIPPNGGFDMTITDGNNVEKIKQMRKESGDVNKFKGKTDEEIRQLVREDFPDGDLRDDEIQIIRNGDDVKVKVVKEREVVK
jgi:hypothetical protein